MKRTKDKKTILRRMLVASIILLLSFSIWDANISKASSWGTNKQSIKVRSGQNVDPCDLMPPGGEISIHDETTCVAQYSSNPGEKIVQIQPNIYNHDTDTLCSNLIKPSDFHVFMSDVDFGDCGIQAEISYQGEPAPGYTGWQIIYYYKGFHVRVATSQDYPANKSWIYDTAGTIEKSIQDSLSTTSSPDPTEDVTNDSQGGDRKSEKECAQMQQEIADLAERAPDSTATDLKLGIIARVVSAPSEGPAIHDYCAVGEGAIFEGSLIKIGDCIRNGKDLLIELNDQNSDDHGGTIIELGEDSEVCFDKFSIYEEYVPRYETVTQLIDGALHAITNAWKGTSIFIVDGPTVVIGVRGSEVFIQHDPNFEFFQVLVIEGHVDVTSKITGETVNLSDNQGVVITGGDIMDTSHVSQEMWDSYMEEYGFNGSDFSKTEVDETESLSSSFNLILILCVVLLCTLILLIIVVIVLFIRKRSNQ